MKRTLSELALDLDRAEESAWEGIYAGAEVEADSAEWVALVRSGRRFSSWLAFRRDAGPPGVPLPEPTDALSRLSELPGASAADAYALVLAGEPLSDAWVAEADPEHVVALLMNSALAALGEGRHWLGWWLGARAGLASIALGRPDLAWRVLDLADEVGGRHGQLGPLLSFEPLREAAELSLSPWVRLAIWRLWPGLKVPLLPALPKPENDHSQPEEVIEQLEKIGAPEIARLVEGTVHWMLAQVSEQFDDEPLVIELRRLAVAHELEPLPEVERLPEWFPRWARLQGTKKHFRLAHLAGRLLLRHGSEDHQLIAVLLVAAARAEDLSAISRGIGHPDVTMMLDMMIVAANELPPELADAFVAAFDPRHVDSDWGREVLIRHSHEFAAAIATHPRFKPLADDVIAAAAGRRAFESDESAGTAYAALLESARSATASVGRPDLLTVERMMVAARKVEVPPISLHLLHRISANDREPLVELVVSVALLSAVRGTEFEGHWTPFFQFTGAQAVGPLEAVQLMPWRIEVLDHLISLSPSGLSLADMFWMRGNARWASEPAGSRSRWLALGDWNSATTAAEREGRSDLVADAAASHARAVASDLTRSESALARELKRLERARAEVSDPRSLTRLLQATAHVLRRTNHEAALVAFSKARELVPAESKYHAELAAEEVQSLLALDRDADALKLAEMALEAAAGLDECVELAMIQHKAGEAFLRAGRQAHGIALMKLALEGSSGRDDRNEAIVRMVLACAPDELMDAGEAAEHLRWLRSRREKMDASMQRDLATVELQLGHRRRDAEAQRRAVADGLASSPGAEDRLYLRLEGARLDLDAGEPVPDLGTMILDAISAAPDERLDAIIHDIVCNRPHRLGGLSVESIVRWLDRRIGPSAAARFLVRAGDTQRGVAHLRRAMAGDLPDSQRRLCEHQLITLLPDESHAERSRLAASLEAWVGQHSEDLQSVKNDLAATFHQMAGEQDVETLRRGWRLVSTVDWTRHEAAVERHGLRTAAELAHALIKAHLMRPASEWRDVLAWLMSPTPSALQEIGELRGLAAVCLLIPGPFAAPGAVRDARTLLDAAVGQMNESTHLAAVLRIEWIESVAEGRRGSRPPESGLAGPLDEAPAWFVSLFHERPTAVPAGALADVGQFVHGALSLRPDRADVFGAALVHAAATLCERFPSEVVDLFGDLIQRTTSPDQGNTRWPNLEGAIQASGGTGRDLLPHLDRGRHPADRGVLIATAPTTPGSSSDPRVVLRARAFEAEGLKDRIQADPTRPDALAEIQESRRVLEEVVHQARALNMPELVSFEISLANSWKQGPASDIERALAIYEAAEARLPPGEEHAARLYKVWADALTQRGRPEDFSKALDLIERSIEFRVGTHRVESMISAAQIAERATQLDRGEQLTRAAGYCLRAFREHAEHAVGALNWCLGVIREFEEGAPDDTRPRAWFAELAQIYPERAHEMRTGQRSARRADVDRLASVLGHPAAELFIDVAARLTRPTELDPSSLPLWAGRRPHVKEAFRERAQKRSLFERWDAIEIEVEALERTIGAGGPVVAGATAARALCLTALARAGRRSVAEARTATETAVAAWPGVPPFPETVQAAILSELAATWSPGDHHDDPVLDFAFAAKLLVRAMELEGGESAASVDTLNRLARARRYAAPSSGAGDLREAERLFRLAAARALAKGSYDMAAQGLHNAADAVSERADGTRLERLVAGERLIREALELVRSDAMRAFYMASLAWQLTLIADVSPPSEGCTRRDEALRAFDAVRTELLSEETRLSFLLHRTICRVAAFDGPNRRSDEITEWRNFLATIPKHRPHFLATVQHNLADVLVRDSESPREFFEGLEFLSACVKVRTLDANPRHHFETSISAAEGLLRAPWRTWSSKREEVPYSPREITQLIETWLARATKAARVLGRGEELERAARDSIIASCLETDPMALHARAEVGWSTLQEAMPYLLTSARSCEREATLAIDIGFAIAQRAAFGPLSGRRRKVLTGGIADAIIGWLARAGFAQQRGLHARLGRPKGVGFELWTRWLGAVEGDALTLGSVLTEIHEKAPRFLREDSDLGGIWSRLDEMRGAVCVAAFAMRHLTLVAVLRRDPQGAQVSEVIVTSDPARAGHADLESLREEVVVPALERVGARPPLVLWVPGPTLRSVSPSALWGLVPVAASLSLATVNEDLHPSRHRSTLVAMADPGPSANAAERGLGDFGRVAFRRICEAAARFGPVLQLASVGASFGHELLGGEGAIRNTPASPEALLAEAREHDVIVLIAHGRCDDLGQASLVCVDAAGTLQPLDVSRLSAAKERFAGASVVLLACSGGRVGASLATPDGLAGVLLAAGASCVVAPLESINVEVAGQVGAEVVEGLCRGLAAWEVLAALQRQGGTGGPTLGRVTKADLEAAAAMQRQSFVSWVG